MTVSINGTNGLTFNDASTQATAATGFGFKNRIINGAMVIDQRNAGAAITPSAVSQYTVDRFNCVGTQASKLTYQQVVDAPAGFVNSVKLTVASAATPSASDQFRFNQPIEGFSIADFGWGTANAQAATISFRAKASIAGTYSVALWNGANGRSYVTTVSLTTAWASYSFTAPGDTTGTWNTGNGVGIELIFDTGGGSNWVAPSLNAWQAGNYFKASGSVSLVSNAAATLNITGVQLEKGSTATAFDYRPYGTEFMLCQRYLPVVSASGADQGLGNGSQYSVATASWCYNFQVQPRIPPTGIIASAQNALKFYANSGSAASTTITFNTATIAGCWILAQAAGTSGAALTVSSNGVMSIQFTGCEL